MTPCQSGNPGIWESGKQKAGACDTLAICRTGDSSFCCVALCCCSSETKLAHAFEEHTHVNRMEEAATDDGNFICCILPSGLCVYLFFLRHSCMVSSLIRTRIIPACCLRASFSGRASFLHQDGIRTRIIPACCLTASGRASFLHHFSARVLAGLRTLRTHCRFKNTADA